MRKLMLTLLLPACLAAAFVVYPFVTVWTIREAIQKGNAEYLEDKVEWPTVRESLRASLITAAGADLSEADDAPKPGLWTRIKARMSRKAVDNLVASYVTPVGLPELFNYRKLYRDNISGDPNAGLTWRERATGFWSRLKRAEFKSLQLFEIEMADRTNPTRHYIGLLTLRGFEWKLTELRVRFLDESQPAALLSKDA